MSLILLLEYDGPLKNLMVRILEQEGYQVIQPQDIEDAIMWISRHGRKDSDLRLIITGLELGQTSLSGFDLLRVAGHILMEYGQSASVSALILAGNPALVEVHPDYQNLQGWYKETEVMPRVFTDTQLLGVVGSLTL